MKVFWSEDAEADLEDIFAFISDDNPRAAAKLCARLDAAGESLALFPHKGRLGKVPDTRELAVASTDYVLVYEIMDDDLIVLRCIHGMRLR